MIGWTEKFAPSTKFQRARISTREDWDDFVKDTYLASYKTGNWDILGSPNYSFLEGYRSIPRHPRNVSEPGWSMSTAFHPVLHKRLVLDGMHRGFQTQKDFSEGKIAREIEIVECYGPEVHVTFWPDFLNLIALFFQR